MHDTLKKFQYPESLIKEYKHWSLLLWPRQLTIGSMVICAREDIRAVPEMPEEAFLELKSVTSDAEHAVRALFKPGKFNYICLMMVDPQVHFHVFPRYETPQNFANLAFEDRGWPSPPDLALAKEIDYTIFEDLRFQLRSHLSL